MYAQCSAGSGHNSRRVYIRSCWPKTVTTTAVDEFEWHLPTAQLNISSSISPSTFQINCSLDDTDGGIQEVPVCHLPCTLFFLAAHSAYGLKLGTSLGFVWSWALSWSETVGKLSSTRCEHSGDRGKRYSVHRLPFPTFYKESINLEQKAESLKKKWIIGRDTTSQTTNMFINSLPISRRQRKMEKTIVSSSSPWPKPDDELQCTLTPCGFHPSLLLLLPRMAHVDSSLAPLISKVTIGSHPWNLRVTQAQHVPNSLSTTPLSEIVQHCLQLYLFFAVLCLSSSVFLPFGGCLSFSLSQFWFIRMLSFILSVSFVKMSTVFQMFLNWATTECAWMCFVHPQNLLRLFQNLASAMFISFASLLFDCFISMSVWICHHQRQRETRCGVVCVLWTHEREKERKREREKERKRERDRLEHVSDGMKPSNFYKKSNSWLSGHRSAPARGQPQTRPSAAAAAAAAAAHTHTHTRTPNARTHTHTHAPPRTHVHTPTRTHTQARTRAHAHTHIHTEQQQRGPEKSVLIRATGQGNVRLS